jgi:DNA-binding CsgD family transcriptional regulator
MDSLERWQAAMAAVESMRCGVCVNDRHGRLLYQNRALREQLSADPGHRALEEAMSDVRHAVLARACAEGDRVEEQSGSSPVIVQLRTAVAEYRIRGVTAGAPLPEPTRGVVITVETRAAKLLTPKSVRSAYGLTPREARVAALLGAAVTNREIAASLSISLHTARRHVESVLRKLGVHSRSEVHARLAEEGRAEGR